VYSDTVLYVKLAKRLLLIAGMTFATLNIWTGAPLFALWVGSQMVRGHGQMTMGAAGAVVGTLAALCIALLYALGALTVRYDEITGRPRRTRRQAPWLRSLRGERMHPSASEQPMRPVEYVLVAMVAVAWGAFEVWFFFFSGSPLGPA
jgi:hypothetical protein